ncbi:hypothetical protein CJ030_MR8G017920 [Morella rubra]|uniref:Uncharacterized protein n=1 Tax=Morella rubra TaxID=262757 RepID=A0A6A1URC2_9ROSI|nr:hypothetical protein CJ030_MR8G017920 [Morella rubra]
MTFQADCQTFSRHSRLIPETLIPARCYGRRNHVGYSYTSEAESGEAIGEHADVHSGSRATLTKSRSDVCCSSTAEASINAELRRRALAIESLSVKTWGDIISGAESSNIGGLRGVLAEQARVGLGRQEFETDSLRFKNWDDESSDSGINTTPPQEDQEGVYSRAWARIVGPQQQEGRLTANITPRQDQDEIEEDVTEPTQGMA